MLAASTSRYLLLPVIPAAHDYRSRDGAMTPTRPSAARPAAAWQLLARKDVLAGLMFMAVAAFGLWLVARLPDRHRDPHGHRLCAAAPVLDRCSASAPSFVAAGHARGASRAPAFRRRRRLAPPIVFVTAVACWFSRSRSSASGSWSRPCCWSGSARSRAAALRPLETALAALVLIVLIAGDLHLGPWADDPGLAGVVTMEFLRQSRARLRRSR